MSFGKCWIPTCPICRGGILHEGGIMPRGVYKRKTPKAEVPKGVVLLIRIEHKDLFEALKDGLHLKEVLDQVSGGKASITLILDGKDVGHVGEE